MGPQSSLTHLRLNPLFSHIFHSTIILFLTTMCPSIVQAEVMVTVGEGNPVPLSGLKEIVDPEQIPTPIYNVLEPHPDSKPFNVTLDGLDGKKASIFVYDLRDDKLAFCGEYPVDGKEKTLNESQLRCLQKNRASQGGVIAL